MLFNEIYGSNYKIIETVLKKACQTPITSKDIRIAARNYGFQENPDNLEPQIRRMLDEDKHSSFEVPDHRPLTNLEKQWLKTILSDRRIRLFDVEEPDFLKDIEPLYDEKSVVYYDQRKNGDPFDDPAYIDIFRKCLTAVRDGRILRITYAGQRKESTLNVYPNRLEYSARDDLFRLICESEGKYMTCNLGRIRSTEIKEPFAKNEHKFPEPVMSEAVIMINDINNALERTLIQFSDYEKSVLKQGDNEYRMTVRYYSDELFEMRNGVLMLGPFIEVKAPEELRSSVRDVLLKQKNLWK